MELPSLQERSETNDAQIAAAGIVRTEQVLNQARPLLYRGLRA